MKFFPPWIVVAVSVAGCAPEVESPRIDVMRGKQIFQTNCAACHGANASGNGPASVGLALPPPSLRGLSAANDGIFPRDFVLGTIDGLERHSDPAAVMPEFGAGDVGPLVQVEENGLTTPIPADLLALANYLESLQD